MIGVDTAAATRLPEGLSNAFMESSQILTIWKGHVLKAHLLYNGPNLDGLTHLGHLPGMSSCRPSCSHTMSNEKKLGILLFCNLLYF